MKGTIAQIAEQLSKQAKKTVDYNAARGYLQVKIALGEAKELGNAPRPDGAKGKPSKIFEISN